MKFHKEFRLVALFAAMMALGAQATPVSSVEVCRAVSAWAAANGSAFADLGSVDTAEAVSENGTNLYWIVRMSNGGAVIASPDTNIDLVISVLEKYDGPFPAAHPLPSILRRDMFNRLSMVGSQPSSSSSGLGFLSSSSSAQTSAVSDDLPEDVKASVKEANAQWEKYSNSTGVSLLGTSLDGGDSSPYVRRIVDGFEEGGRYTHWNQSNAEGGLCYNYYTPHNEVCGCVATAGAAVMQFFGCVEDFGEVGTAVHPCSVYGKQYPDMKTIAGPTDWSILPKSMGGTSDNPLDEEGRKLLGRITYNIGTMVGMSWAQEGPGGESGAYVTDLSKVFASYAAAEGEGGPMSARSVSFTDTGSVAGQYYKMVYAQNWAGFPVILGVAGDRGGHAVVACGYAKDPDGDEFCRVFMGWGGIADAWYMFPDVESFSIVDEAVTMIGYDCTASMDPEDVLELDEAGANSIFNMVGTVPVCGWANVSNTVFTLPGVTRSAGEGDVSVSFTLTASVDSNGYFAVRIPCDTEDLTLEHRDSGMSIQISPFDKDVLSGSQADCAELCAASPDEIVFMVMNMAQSTSVAAARAIALRDGKALLMVSGSPGSARTDGLFDAISELDSTTDISNKFVMVFTPVSSTSIDGVDGDPSIGVFDPSIGNAGLRWWEWNGRLSYTNFIDHVDDDTGEIVYTVDGNDLAAMVAALMNEDGTGILDTGYDAFLRARSDAVVTVTGVDLDSGENTPFEVTEPFPAYGVISKAWTNCEAVVFSAPGTFTNETEGIVYSCVGWSTNEVFNEEGEAVYNATNSVALNLEAGSEITFTWVWAESRYRVRASTQDVPPLSAAGAVNPGEIWCEAGSRMTLTATNALGNYALSGWELKREDGFGEDGTDYAAYYDGTHADDAMVSLNGNTVSFFVFEPVNAYAKYSSESTAVDPAPTYKEYTISVSSSPAELAGIAALKGGLVWGENTTLDPVAYLAPSLSSYVDTTGGVWVCTGWEIDGKTYDGSEIAMTLSSSEKVYAVKCIWALQTPGEGGGEGEGDEDDPVTPGVTPDPIAFSSVSLGSDGVWTVTLTNGVIGCWYHLYATDDLSVAAADWPYAVTEGDNPQQATADGPVTFRVPATGSALFWRAKATATEAGE